MENQTIQPIQTPKADSAIDELMRRMALRYGELTFQRDGLLKQLEEKNEEIRTVRSHIEATNVFAPVAKDLEKDFAQRETSRVTVTPTAEAPIATASGKKRGRPAKATPVRRGRPPKIVAPEIAENAAQIGVAIKRARGRKPQAAAVNGEAASN